MVLCSTTKQFSELLARRINCRPSARVSVSAPANHPCFGDLTLRKNRRPSGKVSRIAIANSFLSAISTALLTSAICDAHGFRTSCLPLRTGASDNRRDSSDAKSRIRRFYADKRMAPQVGLEPTTLRLTAECSAIELLRSVVDRAGARSIATHHSIFAGWR